MGSQDDTIPLDSRRFAELTPILEALAKRPSEEKLINLEYSQFLELFNRFCRTSTDRATNERPLDIVRKRGRWKQMASGFRYGKTGRVNDAWRKLDSETRTHCL